MQSKTVEKGALKTAYTLEFLDYLMSGLTDMTLPGMWLPPLQKSSVWALAACMAAALLEGLLAGRQVRARFSELRLPRLAPPLWVWTVIGGLYYVLFFCLIESLLSRPSQGLWTSAAITLTVSLLLANACWNWIFFRRKDLHLSFTFFLPYSALAVTLSLILWHIHAAVWPWFTIYLVYLGYATWWGHSVWRLNRDSGIAV